MLGYLPSGMSASEILADFPDLEADDIRAGIVFMQSGEGTPNEQPPMKLILTVSRSDRPRGRMHAFVTLDRVNGSRWSDALRAELRRLGARRVWSADTGDGHFSSYRIGPRIVRIEWDSRTRLRIHGATRLVESLLHAVEPFAALREQSHNA